MKAPDISQRDGAQNARWCVITVTFNYCATGRGAATPRGRNAAARPAGRASAPDAARALCHRLLSNHQLLSVAHIHTYISHISLYST